MTGRELLHKLDAVDPGPWTGRRRAVLVLVVLAVCSVSVYLVGKSSTDALRKSQEASCVRGNAAKAAQDIVIGAPQPPFLILNCRATTERHVAVPVSRPQQAQFIRRVHVCLAEFRRHERPSDGCATLLNGAVARH